MMPMIPLGLKETKEIEMQEPFRVSPPWGQSTTMGRSTRVGPHIPGVKETKEIEMQEPFRVSPPWVCPPPWVGPRISGDQEPIQGKSTMGQSTTMGRSTYTRIQGD